MSRALAFAAGLVLGAAGVYALFLAGHLPLGAALPVEGIPGVAAPHAPAPAPREDLRRPPVSPAVPASNAGAAPATLPALPPPSAPGQVPTAATAVGGAALLLPVQGIAPAQLVDTFTQSRGSDRAHDAIDIMAARGTPVLAVADGRVAKLFDSKAGGLTVYQFDREEKLADYYAHLERYAPGLAEGAVLRRGQVLRYVGSTGNASPDAPHLHFAIFVLGPEKNWWQGTAINPYPFLGGR